MAQKGAKRIELIGLGDKRQITAIVCGTLSGDFLPFQLIYTGKTTACLPSVKFPKDWLLSYTPNHWSNEDKTKEYTRSVIIAYVQRKRKELSLADTFSALTIFDVFKGKTTDVVFQMLRDNHIYVTVEPVLRSPGLSGHLCITAMDTRSQIFSHTNVCIVVCIKRSPV